jgi:hypothetical protein
LFDGNIVHISYGCDDGAKLSDAKTRVKQEKPTNSKQNLIRKRKSYKKEKNVAVFLLFLCGKACFI